MSEQQPPSLQSNLPTTMDNPVVATMANSMLVSQHQHGSTTSVVYCYLAVPILSQCCEEFLTKVDSLLTKHNNIIATAPK